MFRSISSISFSGQLEDKIEAAAAAGFDGIELFREDIIGFEGAPEDIPVFARNAGIGIVSLQSLRDFEGLAGDAREAALRRAERFLDLARRVGAPMLIVCANTRPEASAETAVLAADLAELARMAADRGLTLGYEALATSAHINTLEAAWEVVRNVAAPNLGLVVGAVHLFAMETDPAFLAQIPPERIALVHLADAPTTRIDRALLTQSFRLFPGQGNLPVAALYSQLLALGVSAPMSIETFNDQIRSLPPSQIARDGMRAFHLLAETHRRDTQPHSDLVAPSFVEFVAQEDEAADLESLLRAMGFARTHEAGQVALWRQGDAVIALNQMTEGLAHSIYLLQGLSVSGLGVIVDDLNEMDARIGLFHGERVGEAAEPPYGLPVLRGPGGSVFYLASGPIETTAGYAGFAPTGEVPAALISRIDHCAQALQPNLFLSGLMFYRSIFDMRSEEIRDVLDPHGTVHSRTLANDTGAVRISLNASFGAGTTTQRFLEKSGFAPWHHIAFHSDDIFAFAQTMEPFDVLQVPANYYEDLACRFDLDAGLIEQMKALNIFYDRDAGGEYFQLYTRAINGVFFEVVERRGYTGMGAANAPVRMLAQLRELETEDALHLL
ncbi:TIM barrel protein [Thioclava sp. A2]|uniref:bifunctional sugar phosphate isomerase/epimerase/4-hydroxyphenylpyruvate dioxygenase family protein n=1 Tax=Thioclava sp. FCG-A2 TaxID=3080562 RepID=UPI002952B538|nr:TIM barrel protein [Thioclava sp. A2]MDV7270926.1 TIM barrel protein [Thioclava sp. A2]